MNTIHTYNKEALKTKRDTLLKNLKEYDYIAEDPSEIVPMEYVPEVKLPDVFKTTPKSYPNAKLVPNMPIYTATVMGHVDHGKSTLLGRLLLLCGRIKSHVIDTYREEAKLKQKATFEFAWALDTTAAEREKGVTIDNSFKEFNTQDRYFTMIDAPGHKDYLKNSLNAIMQADVAILALDIKRGIDVKSNTKEHLLAAKASGVNSLIVALTKIDTVPIEDRADLYMERVEEVKTYLKKTLNWPEKRVTVLPVNSLKEPSWNIIKSTPEELPFYKGPTLIHALNEIEMDPVRSDLPLRIAVDEILTGVPGTNVVATGKVLSGSIKANDKVILNPGNHPATIRTVTMHHQEINTGVTNCNVGVDIVNINNNQIKRGSIISDVKSPAKTIQEFTCDKLLFLEHPTTLNTGSKVIGHYLTGHVTLLIKSISQVYDLTKYQGDFNEADPSRDHQAVGYTHGEIKNLKPKSVARVVFVPEKPIVLEPVTQNPKMGNLLLRDFGQTLGVSKVTSVKESF